MFTATYIFIGEDDYTIDFYNTENFIKYQNGIVSRRKQNMTASFLFTEIGRYI